MENEAEELAQQTGRVGIWQLLGQLDTLATVSAKLRDSDHDVPHAVLESVSDSMFILAERIKGDLED